MKIADEAGESASIAAVSVSPVPNRIRPIVTVVCHKSDTPARNSLIERIEALGKKYCAQISDVPPPLLRRGKSGNRPRVAQGWRRDLQEVAGRSIQNSWDSRFALEPRQLVGTVPRFRSPRNMDVACPTTCGVVQGDLKDAG